MVNFKKDKRGKYYFTASLGFDSVTGKRIQKMRSGFNTVKEAREAYAEIISNFGKSAYSQNSTMLFEEFLNTIFLPYYKGRVKERTYTNRLNAIKMHFSFFFKMKLTGIKPIHIQKWQNELSENYENSYIRNIFGLFQMSLDRAVVLGMIPSNPAKVVGNVKKSKKEIDFWTKEEFEKVVKTFYIEDYYQHFSFICIWLLFMTGMRIGEATALTWDNVNLDEKFLQVKKSLYYKNADTYEFVEPKTRASIRTIYLDDDTVHFLRDWKNRQDEMGGIKFVLSYNSVPTQKHTVRYIIKRHAKLAEVHDVRIHALRHSHASLLISMGKNALLIKERLGHEDVQTTLGTYGHLYPNSSNEIADDLKGMVNVEFTNQNIAPEVTNQFTKEVKKKV
ncbi:site-specific integrase [Enterococcus wangshanyuanii]|uniref:Site-specific integrase n=1 Tax=Enterococcus wangshanyuanii TaxID=2005703 RepID=A0ABQ1PP97_9ENTE|nr:site-specific integrase [Enterococcus wangshanyuanii]GGD00342.1 site-specific integrase [Enterococcus wangshanyuanii]